MQFVNLTPHVVRLNDGREFLSAGVCRVESRHTPFVGDIASVVYGNVTGLPDAVEGTTYIVSALVMTALRGSRPDCVSPASGHPDTRRNAAGQIDSVPGFVRA